MGVTPARASQKGRRNLTLTYSAKAGAALVAALLIVLAFAVSAMPAGAAAGIETEETLHDGKEAVFRSGFSGRAEWALAKDGEEKERGVTAEDGSFRLTLRADEHEGALLRAVSEDGQEHTLTLHIETHQLVHTLRKEASCTAEGMAEHWKCSVCGAVFGDGEGSAAAAADQLRIGALGHDMHFRAKTEPQSELPGTAEHWECGRCGERFFDEDGKQPAGDEDLYISPTNHQYEASVRKPSCTEGGYTEYLCSHCGDSYRDHETDPLGHDLTYVPQTLACHTDPGEKAHYVCSRCGALFADTEEREPVEASDLILEAPGHSWEVHRTEADCTRPGSILSVCTVCGAEGQKEEVPAAGHDLARVEGKAPTNVEDGWLEHWRCKVCGAIFADASAEKPLEEKNIVLPASGGSSVPTGDAETAGGLILCFLAASAAAARILFSMRSRAAER